MTNNKDENGLLPCPFCKSGETRIDEQSFWTGMRSQVVSVSVRHWCPKNPLQSYVEVKATTREEAVKTWNTRAQPQNVDAKSTPAAQWRVNGEPDPHAGKFDKERAQLTHGHMTDDEFANAFFIYDHRKGLQSMLWLQSAKDRIRWLSRALERSLSHPKQEPVNADLLKLRDGLDKMPSRIELMGGQKHKYLDKAEVLAWIDEAISRAQLRLQQPTRDNRGE